MHILRELKRAHLRLALATQLQLTIAMEKSVFLCEISHFKNFVRTKQNNSAYGLHFATPVLHHCFLKTEFLNEIMNYCLKVI